MPGNEAGEFLPDARHNTALPESNPKRRRVAVIGASASGLYTAYLLARGGAQVQVVERAETMDPEERTLIVTDRMRKVIGQLGEPSIVNQIRRFELFTDGRFATLTLNRPDLVIERAALVRHLAEKAMEAGCQLRLGRLFRSVKEEGQDLVAEVERRQDSKSEEIRAEAVVGGDGASSKVAESAGWPPQQTVPLVQAIVPLPKDMAPDTVRVWFVPDDTPYFYWLIPESPTQGALGLIGESGRETRCHLDRFLEKKGFEPLQYQGARIPLYTGWVPVRRRMGAGDVYLVGDAAGQVKVTTVGGVVTGFRGATGVAQAILNGGANAELRMLRRELDLHLLLRRCLHPFRQDDYKRLVDLLNEQVRRSLGEYSRDDALRVLWHACISQPRLVLMGLRGLLMRGRIPAPPLRDSSGETGA